MPALAGVVQAAPTGSVGFDADTKLDLNPVKLFRQSGYRFCLRYFSLDAENSCSYSRNWIVLSRDGEMGLYACWHTPIHQVE
jgi:hypothetical protein